MHSNKIPVDKRILRYFLKFNEKYLKISLKEKSHYISTESVNISILISFQNLS